MTYDQREKNNKILYNLYRVGLLSYDEQKKLQNQKLPAWVTALLQRPVIEVLDVLEENVNQMLWDC